MQHVRFTDRLGIRLGAAVANHTARRARIPAPRKFAIPFSRPIWPGTCHIWQIIMNVRLWPSPGLWTDGERVMARGEPSSNALLCV